MLLSDASLRKQGIHLQACRLGWNPSFNFGIIGVCEIWGGKASRFRFAAQVGRTKIKKVTDKSREAMSEMEERRKYCIFN